MNLHEAIEILSTLADGINPVTGEILPREDCCNQAEVIRALHTALVHLDKPPQRERQSPENAGKPWSQEEVRRVEEEYRSGMRLSDIAKAHARTRGAITAKLTGMGLIEPTGYYGRRR